MILLDIDCQKFVILLDIDCQKSVILLDMDCQKSVILLDIDCQKSVILLDIDCQKSVILLDIDCLKWTANGHFILSYFVLLCWSPVMEYKPIRYLEKLKIKVFMEYNQNMGMIKRCVICQEKLG